MTYLSVPFSNQNLFPPEMKVTQATATFILNVKKGSSFIQLKYHTSKKSQPIVGDRKSPRHYAWNVAKQFQNRASQQGVWSFQLLYKKKLK